MRRLAILSGGVAAFLLVAMFVALLGQVVLRPLGVLFPWVEEFAIFAFVVMVFFAVALAHARNEHLTLGFVHEAAGRRSPRLQRLMSIINGLAELAFLLIFLTGLWLMTRQSWDMFAGAMSGFRHGYVYLASAVAVAISVGVVAARLVRTARGTDTKALGR
jgi:TRAP-type C4-dicarboxylate transport system permease small subunit